MKTEKSAVLRIRNRLLKFWEYIMRKICSKNLTLTGHLGSEERQWETVNKLPNKRGGRTGTEMDNYGNKHC